MLNESLMGGAVALIPAYKPNRNLIKLTDSIIKHNFKVVIVNDGSSNKYNTIFNSLNKKAIVIKNAINLGKGAALKYGINYILNNFKKVKCIVTIDCDGQHTIKDILNIRDNFLKHSDTSLVLGVREFNNKIPLRSKIGNKLTKLLFRVLFAKNILDTQTGLRAIEINFAKNLLKSSYNGYEFEMDMIIKACNMELQIIQVPIDTIYINNNATSHFNPFKDSISIYFVLFRHITNSILTALLDYIIFVFLFSLGYTLFTCMLSGRIIAGSFNFIIGKKIVFKSSDNFIFQVISYVVLTIILMLVSMKLIEITSSYTGFNEIIVKPICELMIFSISFLIQRLFIFTPKARLIDIKMGGGINDNSEKQTFTDWESYYKNRVNKFSIPSITRKISANMILKYIKMQNLIINNICEFGGGDSCFYKLFRESFINANYSVFDNSINGVIYFNKKYENVKTKAYNINILTDNINGNFDLVFSVGLIEHFNKEETKQICIKHFQSTKKGGIVLITYPTPTILYKITRGILERFNLWKFYDERPLLFNEVNNTCKKYGELKVRKLNVAILLTQEILIYKKY